MNRLITEDERRQLLAHGQNRAAGGSIVDMALGKPDMEQVFVGIMNQN